MVFPSISGRAATSKAATRAAPEEMPTGIPSVAGGATGHVQAVVVGDLDDLVDHRPIENRRYEAGADPLDLVRAGLAPREHWRS